LTGLDAAFAYRRVLAGGAVLTVQTLASEVLRGNPLGDPHVRAHPLLLPPGGRTAGLPLVVVLFGYTGFAHKVLNKGSMWQENLPERIARGMAEGRIPPAVLVWPACETRLGGSQFVNSAGTGRYEDFVCDEVVPAIERAHGCGGGGKRVVVGKSSGGFGALHLAMRRPGLFAAAGSHCGDLGFDLSHVRGFADALNAWRAAGGPTAFLAALPRLEKFGLAEHAAAELLALGHCYTPDAASPWGCALPVDPESGEPQPEVFARWLAFDPLRRVEADASEADALRDLKALYLDAGERDEFALQWGLRRFVARLRQLGIAHRAEFHGGGHFDTDARYEISLPFLLSAL
jgi:hypothetical protein